LRNRRENPFRTEQHHPGRARRRHRRRHRAAAAPDRAADGRTARRHRPRDRPRAGARVSVRQHHESECALSPGY